MTPAIVLFLAACGSGNPAPAPAPAPAPTATPAPKPVTEPAVSPLSAQITQAMTSGATGTVGKMVVKVPKTHKVHPGLFGMDYNAYPAENARVFEGTVEGPLGNHPWSLLWLAASRDMDDEGAPVQLDAVLVYPTDDPEEGPDPYTVQTLPTKHPEGSAGATLLDVNTLTVADIDGDGELEVTLAARYQPFDGTKSPYVETMKLDVRDGALVRLP